MTLTDREWATLIHGMGFGALFLLAFAGALAGLYSLRPELVTTTGVKERVLRLKVGFVAMAVASWGTVITGTWIIYPWYRDKSPESPRSILIASEETAKWHEFGMEWKEHVAWISPMLATAAAFVVIYYGVDLIKNDRARKIAMMLLVLAFTTAAVAGLFGALITKIAPVI
jgi:hypothetical protein